ncbi:related to DRAP deaminase RIB2 [Serendipita indica DSM 11827]|uniref:Related to DRAP deaminase RIB2 n=1 Tax=Serendipita indica (strain DSM 11827) TaxID=1109443 RepID=G4T617_SERID|nr:related to DRAP deaminase RIB2 [Serendipita indica DSM 11827]
MAAPGLKKVAPYWHPYATMAKQRWWDRELLELVSTEFRDRSIEYYRFAIESGIVSINGKTAHVGQIMRNGDRLENIIHRHELITSQPVKVLHVDKEKDLIVIDKPGTCALCREVFQEQSDRDPSNGIRIQKVYPVNRLDRLTSGCMVMALSPTRARQMCDEFMSGNIKKEYVARCRGEFPATEVVCEEPLLTIDRQMGLNIVHPEGKPAKTAFNRIFYDPRTDTSVLHCHLPDDRIKFVCICSISDIPSPTIQSIATSLLLASIFCDDEHLLIQAPGPKLGQGGIDTTPSSERAPPVPPPSLTPSIPSSLATAPSALSPNDYRGRSNIMPLNTFHQEAVQVLNGESSKVLLPRETGEDIGFASPVPLSAEAVKVITALRNMKDGDEDWSRWRDNVFLGKKPLVPSVAVGSSSNKPASTVTNGEACGHEGTQVLDNKDAQTEDDPVEPVGETPDGKLYCTECYLPLHPDPPPGKLYIFLHALRYTTSHGAFETEMPWWADPNWEGDGWVQY